MSKTIRRLAPGWHGEAKTILNDNFGKIHDAFMDATQKALWLGLFLIEIKERGRRDGSIPHGEFGPWMERTIPGVKWNRCNTYMRLARNVAERGKFQIVDFHNFATGANLSSLQIGAAAPSALPPKIREIRERIDSIVEGRTQQQLLLDIDFKQAKTGEEDELEPSRGRTKGCKGTTKEQRAASREREELDRIEEIEISSGEYRKWMERVGDAKGVGMIGEAEFKKLRETVNWLAGVLNKLHEQRGDK